MATREAGTGKLTSRTTYTFDVQARTLLCEDADLYRPSVDHGVVTPMHYKRVSSRLSEEDLQYEMWLSRVLIDDVDAARDGADDLLQRQAEMRLRDGSVEIRFKEEVFIGPRRPVRLGLRYKVQLEGSGEDLFYCGAVQPSDLTSVRSLGIDLSSFRKRVRVVVGSTTPFRAWMFNGDTPLHYPLPSESAPKHLHLFDHEMEVRLGGWERAWYFGLFVSTR
jgi:hypothetical protein